MRLALVRRLVIAGMFAGSAVALATPPGLTPSTDQPPPKPPGNPQKPPGGGGGVDAVKKRIRALRASTLIDELQLDEATAGKLFPIFGRYDEETEKLLKTRQDIQHALAGAGELKDPAAVNKIIDAAIANQRAFWDLEDKRLADLRAVLTPAQAARLVVVLPAIERKIQNQLRKALQQAKRKQNGGGAGGGGGGKNKPQHPRPVDDDDDDDEQ